MPIPPLIALEEHFFSRDADDSLTPYYELQFKDTPALYEKLHDVGPLRIQHMDKGHVSMQVVSHAPGTMTAAQCRAANDELAAAVRARPDRFAGFAVLPVTDDPPGCATELTRCVKELGFVGALIDNTAAHGTVYYDGDEYLPMWRAAEQLDVPVYLHPTWPSTEETKLRYTGNFSAQASRGLGSGGWGWHADVGLHLLRLFASGLFDRCPRLKIVIGHMGEMVPFMLDRLVWLTARWGPRDRLFREVYETNVWITTSGVWSVDPMATILRNTPLSHILYSVDYPFTRQENELGLKFMRDLEASGLVTAEQLEMIAYRNAQDLLGVKATKVFE